MPQPFNRKGRPVRMSPAVLAELPHLGISIALITSHWNKLEQTLGLMHTWLLAGEEPTAFEFYHELIDLGMREKAFMAAARERLPPDMIGEIAKLFIDVRKVAKRRAAVVHGTWCSIATKPHSLFLAEPRDVGRKLNELFTYLRKSLSDPAKREPTKNFDLTPEELIEYKHHDFNDILKSIISLDAKADALENTIPFS
jgi:hypothetical protein